MWTLCLVLGYSVLLLALVVAWFFAPTFEVRSVVSTALVLLIVLFLSGIACLRDGPRAVRMVLGWTVLLVTTWVALTRHLAAGPAWELAYGRGVVGLLIASYLLAFVYTLDAQTVSKWLKAAIALLYASLRALLEFAAIFFIVGGLGFCALELLRRLLDPWHLLYLLVGVILCTHVAPVRGIAKLAVFVTRAGTYWYWMHH